MYMYFHLEYHVVSSHHPGAVEVQVGPDLADVARDTQLTRGVAELVETQLAVEVVVETKAPTRDDGTWRIWICILSVMKQVNNYYVDDLDHFLIH